MALTFTTYRDHVIEIPDDPALHAMTSMISHMVFHDPMSKFQSMMNVMDIPMNLSEPMVEVRPSNIHGRGLFALTMIEPDQMITMYPPHVGIHCPDGNVKGLQMHQMIMDQGLPYMNVTFMKSLYEQYRPYVCSVCPHSKIIGLPHIAQDRRMLAHFVNDGARCLSEDGRDEYTRLAVLRDNAVFETFHHRFIVLRAVRTIHPGDEILAMYGAQYWLEL